MRGKTLVLDGVALQIDHDKTCLLVAQDGAEFTLVRLPRLPGIRCPYARLQRALRESFAEFVHELAAAGVERPKLLPEEA